MKIIPTLKEEACDVAVVIGRWQMPHKGHETLFNRALAVGAKVVVVIGSAFRARDTRNPFNASERQKMILAAIPSEQHKRISFVSVRDYYDDQRWARAVTTEVDKLAPKGASVSLVGFKKDHTSYYLDHFPAWRGIAVIPEVAMDATPLRNIYFSSPSFEAASSVLDAYVSPGVLQYLAAWSLLPDFARLSKEHQAVSTYRKTWTAPVHLTADALVRVNDHVLLVKRGGDIGRDLWALPGGFVNPGEQFLPAALRELKEETCLGYLATTLVQALKSSAVFDHPLRSPRGRLVTNAFYFAFGGTALPEVHAADDAMDAKWVPIAELADYEDKLFEDHACILDHFVGIEGY